MSTPRETYPGNCHCGAVAFTFTLPPLTSPDHPVVRCNCSVCTKLGLSMRHGPRRDVQFLRGEDKLVGYQTIKGASRELRFCGTCATVVLFDVIEREGGDFGDEWIGVNVNTVVDFDLDAVTIKKFNGWDMGEKYKVSE